jgi:type I restriction enzyme S subunit
VTKYPSTWDEKALSEVAEVQLGRQRSPQHHHGPNMRTYLRAANVTWGGLDLKDVKSMNFTDVEMETYRLCSGDIVVNEASGSPSEVGKPAMFRGEIEDCAFQNHLIRIRSKSIEKEFLLYFLMNNALSGEYVSQSQGVGINHLGKTKLASWITPVPPVVEQQRIVEILEEQFSRLDAALASVRTVRNKALAFRVSYLHDVFINDATGLLGLEPMPLRDLLALSIGGIWGDEPGVGEIDVNVIRVTELKAFGKIEPSTAARRSVSEKQLLSRELHEGDLLLEKSGGGPKTPVGRVGIVVGIDARSVCANFMQLMRPDIQQVEAHFLFHFLNYFHMAGNTSSLQTSTTNIRNIKAREYLETPVPLGSLDDQRRVIAQIESELSRLESAMVVCNQLEFRIASQRRSLLHAAFNGTLTARWRETADV